MDTPTPETPPTSDAQSPAGATLTLHQLRKIVTKQGRVIARSRVADGQEVYAVVPIDFWGKGSDPRGERAAAAAFESGNGQTLAEISADLAP